MGVNNLIKIINEHGIKTKENFCLDIVGQTLVLMTHFETKKRHLFVFSMTVILGLLSCLVA